MKLIKKHRIIICLLAILIFAAVLRFVNYSNRWGIAYDQARDAIVAREAFQSGRVPLIGPFSASGPFVFGPHWYWTFMAVTALYPGSVLTPWIFQGMLYLVIVYLMYLTGKEFLNKYFGLLLSLFTAVSTAQIAQSTNLSYSSFIGFIATIAFYLLIKYINKPRTVTIFLLALTIGTAINVHFQAMGLLVLLPAAVVFGRMKLKDIALAGFGLLIPFTPMVVFDLQSGHFQSRHLFEYFTGGGNRASMPKRWLTYAGILWPDVWARIIGGYRIISYLIITLLSILTAKIISGKKATKPFLAVVFVFLLNFVTLRYLKGSLFDAFFVYLHPAVLLLTSWACWQILKMNRIAGTTLCLLILSGSMYLNYFEIINATNTTAVYSTTWMNKLQNKFPGEKFAVYDFNEATTSRSFPLVLFLQANDLIDDNAVKVGTGLPKAGTYPEHPVIYHDTSGLQLVDLSSSGSAQLADDGWVFINPGMIYRSIVEWYKYEDIQ